MVENQGEAEETSDLLFASFSLSDDYTPTLKKRASSGKTQDENHQQLVMLSVIPILKGFMVAITD
jgi:hypothetical protein